MEVYDHGHPPPDALCEKVCALQEQNLVDNLPTGSSDGFLYTLYTGHELKSKVLQEQARLYLLEDQKAIITFALTTDIQRFYVYRDQSRWESVQELALDAYRYLEQIVVRRGQRHMRFGSTLLRAIRDYEPLLVTDFSLSPRLNRAARDFFKSQGFKVLGRMHDLDYRGQHLSFEALITPTSEG